MFPARRLSASSFNGWAEGFAKDVEVCVLQLPGRGRRLFEAPPTSMDQIIEALLEEFQPIQEAPIALFGHSFGALVAFEFARRLGAINFSPQHLFVSGQFAPQLPDPEAPIRHLPDREFIAEVHRRYDGIPEDILRDDKMMALLLTVPALRDNLTMKETYRYVDGPLLEYRVSTVGGQQKKSVNIGELAGVVRHKGSAEDNSNRPTAVT